MWIMVSDHPFYPRVEYHMDEDDARASARVEQACLFASDGTQEAKVVVALVISLQEGKSHY